MRATFIIQSHRGAGVLAPENSLAAFEQAWDLGTYPEADLRTTSDGVLVACHDPDLRRLLPEAFDRVGRRPVAEVPWEELERAAGASVPRLEAILQRMPGRPERGLYLDIKQVDLASLAAVVHAWEMEGRVILASPRHEEIRRWRELCPAGETLLWMGGEEAALQERLESLRATEFAGVTQLQVHVRLREADLSGGLLPSEPFLAALGRELRERGILFQALPWNIALPEVYERLLDLGVASFATDYPETVRRLVDARAD